MTRLLMLQMHPSAILALDLDEPGAAPKVLVEDAGPAPDGIVVVDGMIHWTTMGSPEVDPLRSGEAALDFSASNGGLHAIPLAGGDRRRLLAPGAVTTPKQVTSAGAHLYWSDREGCRVTRSDLDGTAKTDLVVRAPDPEGLAECVGVAVDAAGGHLYWTQKGPADAGRGRIFRAPLELPRDPRSREDIETLWDDLPEPIDLELHGDRIFWTDRGAAPSGNSLNSAPVPAPGRCGQAPLIHARGFDEAIGLTIDEADGTAFVSDLAGTIRAVPLTAGSVEAREIAHLDGPATGLALVR